jgi:topoisomerase-4 subunit A
VAHLESLMRRNFVDYASYAILDRAIPDLRDGLKPVQRRILHTLFEMHDGRYHKVANVIGETMKLHPHGDASIADALVVLANKGLFIDRQGNFGNTLTGHPAAAPRYIECRLTPLALETLFDPDLTAFVPSYDGRSREPRVLPARLPVLLALGAEGIAVGMSTRILPHNLRELWEAQIALLEGRGVELAPDFPQGGLADVSDYRDGRGRVVVRARIEARSDKRIAITEIPFGTTTDSLIASIEAEVQRGRVQVASIHDYTTARAEIELALPRGATAQDVIPQLYAYTDCSVAHSSNMVVIEGRQPVERTVSELLSTLTERLVEQLRAALEWEQRRLVDRKHWLTLERIFVEKRVYKRIEKARTEAAVRAEVVAGMNEHASLLVRPLDDEDVKRLLELRIRRISAYDLARNRDEIAGVDRDLASVAAKLADIRATSIAYVRDLLERYGADFPRRTELAIFEAVDKKAVARPAIKLSCDSDTGFFGSSVKGDRFALQVSEYDLVLAVARDGTYRVMTPPDKVLFPAGLLHVQVFDPDRGAEFTVVYRDRQRRAFAKRIRIERFIRNKEYRLIRDEGGRLDLLLPEGRTGILSLRFAPSPRQRVRAAKFDLSKLARTGATARGARLAARPVAAVKLLVEKAPPRKSTARASQTQLF